MRRVALAAAAAALAAWFAPSAAAAPATIEAGTGGANAFAAPAYAHDAGTVAQLQVVTGTHNVTGPTGPGSQPLFSTPNISAPGSTAVNGTQFLDPGSYVFVCTLHPGMSSVLNVSGTPLPRPIAELKVKSKSLDQVVRQKAVKVGVTLPAGASGGAEVNAAVGKRSIGIARQVSSSGVVKVRLTGKGHSLLEKRDQATIRVEATLQFGGPSSAKKKLK